MNMDGCGDVTCKDLRSCCPKEFPSPPPKGIGDAGVKCCTLPPITCRKSVGLPIQPAFAIDPKAPIEIEWPPEPSSSSEVKDTGPRPDLLALIPDQIIPQVVTMMAKPMVINTPEADVELDAIPHQVCPDSSLHTRVTPKENKKKVELRMPPQECPIRGPPCRSWTQCVENPLQTDAVRRPMANPCYNRPLPPLVLPKSQVWEMKMSSTEIERKQAEAEKLAQERECKRLQARQRQGKWNYTVESLLDRKREQDLAKQKGESDATRELMEEAAREKKAQSEAQIAKAKQLMLYRKGLIRDLHSALAYSKMMQDIEKSKGQSSGCGCEAKKPLWAQKCTLKMMHAADTRRDYEEEHKEKLKQKKPVNQKLLARLKKVEEREKEQKGEQQMELLCMQQMIKDNLPELPEKYLKYLQDAECDDQKKMRDFQNRSCELYEAVGDKLAADAFIESAELEIDRQACEFEDYKREVDAIRKAKEQQLIDEKVAFNIAKSEAAARVLVQMQQKKKKENAGDYDRRKMTWETEYEWKKQDEEALKEKQKEKVYADFNNRQCQAKWKRCELDPAREWARERLVEGENYERECDDKSERRRAAEDIALFNKAQASAKHCREQKKRYLDDVYAAKMKNEYIGEMREMKAYAKECIDDWERKGRSTLPMHQAMKKWDYDAGMYPYLFCETPLAHELNPQGAAACGNKVKCSSQTTSSRLGFGSGGC